MTHPQPIERELFSGSERVPAPRAERVPPPAERLARALRRRWLFALFAFAVTAMAVCGVAELIPPAYQAQASVEFSAPAELIHFADPDSLAVDSPEDLHTLEWQFRSRASAVATVEALQSHGTAAALDPAAVKADADRLLRHLDIDPVQGSRVLTLRYRDPDPARAAAVVNTLIDVTVQRLQQQRQNGLRQAQATLARQLDDAQQALEASQQNLHAFAVAVPEVAFADSDADASASPAAERLRALETAKTQADIQSVRQRAQLRAGSRPDANGWLPGNLSPDLAAQLLLRRADLEARIRSLSAQYVPTALPLVQARQELAGIDESLRRYRAAGQTLDRTRWQANQAEQAGLAAAIQHQQQLLATGQQARLRYAELRRQSDAAGKLLDEIEARQKQLAVLAAWSPTPAHVVDAAAPAQTPARPRWGLTLVVAVLAAAVAAPALALLRDHADRRLHLPEAAELGVPLLATLGWPERAHSEEVKLLPAEDLDAILVAVRVAARQYGSYVFTLTGPRDGEGKSTVAAHLAQCLAETGDPVLVIDANFRHARLHRHAGLPTAPGLAEFLAGKNSMDETIRPVALPGRSECWSLMPAGTPSLTPSQLLSLPALHDLLRTARRQYQWILIAGGPVLQGVEIRLLLDLSDAGILVVSTHGASRAGAREAMHRLRGWKAPLLGLVRIGGESRV